MMRSAESARCPRIALVRGCGALLILIAALAAAAGQAPAPPPPDRAAAEALARRAAARMQALQREADALAVQERTLLVDLQRLDVERRLREEEVRKVTADAQAVSREVDDTGARIASLERDERTARPGLERRIVELYKLGRGGYLRLLLSVNDLRSTARAYRTVASLAEIDRARVREHHRTLESLRAELKALEERRTRLASLQRKAESARAAADRAATAHATLVQQIDTRRDLNAQLAGELQTAQLKLQQALTSMAAGHAAVEPVSLPLRPFQGDLDWPTTGPVLSRFRRQPAGSGPAVPQNGIEIGGTDGSPVTAVHDGTVAFADTFTGYGNLVILEHGSQAYSLYGHLAGIEVNRGDKVERGRRLGSVGTSPTGPLGLYFELRIDGKPVDPLQWLRKR